MASATEKIPDPLDPSNWIFLLILRYNDKRDIFFISNFCGSSPTKQKWRFVPFLVHMYNQCMKYIDKIDSVLGRNNHKGNWSSSMMSYILRLVLNNSWRYWQVNHQTSCSMREFEMALVSEYLEEKNLKISAPHSSLGGQTKTMCSNCGESNTTIICTECEVPLHSECFSEYHENIYFQKNDKTVKKHQQLR